MGLANGAHCRTPKLGSLLLGRFVRGKQPPCGLWMGVSYNQHHRAVETRRAVERVVATKAWIEGVLVELRRGLPGCSLSAVAIDGPFGLASSVCSCVLLEAFVSAGLAIARQR